MCLSIPGKVTEINKDSFVIQYGPQEIKVPNSIIEDIEEGDWVIVENKFITQKLTEKQAKEILKLIK
ncbi:MAG: HypC/HybG/HupF family hydrogenase formation chaperone [Patescibacteria group bacterium]